MRSSKLQEIEQKVKDLGYSPGTPAYETALVRAKVHECRRYRGTTCKQCSLSFDCTLYKRLLLMEWDAKFHEGLRKKAQKKLKHQDLDSVIVREGLEVHTEVGSSTTNLPGGTDPQDPNA